MKILNLTQHTATPEQTEAGVIEPSAEDKQAIRGLLTFDSPPCREAMRGRAERLALIAKKYARGKHPVTLAMIGGAPFFMAHLEQAILDYGMRPVYAFSRREVIETTQEDGSVAKRAVFRHAGWVEVSP